MILRLLHRGLTLGLILLTLLLRPDETVVPADWRTIDEEWLKHFQNFLHLKTRDPPGGEQPEVDYLKSVLEAEGIETKIFSIVANRPNLVARIRGCGTMRPLIFMDHTARRGKQRMFPFLGPQAFNSLRKFVSMAIKSNG